MRAKQTLKGEAPVMSVQVRKEHASDILVQRKGTKSVVEQWNIEEGAKISSITTGSTSFAKICQVTPSTFLSPLEESHQLGLFELGHSKPKHVLQLASRDSGMIMDVQIFQSLVAVVYEQRVALWNLANPSAPVEEWPNPTSPGAALTCLTVVGRQLWVASEQGDLWAVKTDPLKTKELFKVPKGIGSMRTRDDDRLVVIAGWDKMVHLRDAHDTILAVLEGHEGNISAVAFRKGRFATASADQRVLLWDVYQDSYKK
eukprot:GEMP01080117.1.p1 GENE.GEMP01080117.1~~GEMP01080117.1.p1  ORF type:complete len:258 (+),score=61.15 GEMP01080117.1:302-1075(+)